MAEQPNKAPAKAAADHAPWKPAKYEAADATAIQALYTGTASGEQQKRALTWIINSACATYDMSFRPGPDGERETNFAEGRRSVGLQFVKLCNIKIGLLRR